MTTGNQDVARMLYELGVLSERLDDRSRRFRARAYRRAAEVVAELDTDVLTMPADELTAVDGIGPGTAARIDEIRRTGTIARLEELRAIDPAGAEALLRVPGLGPRTVARLRDTLGVRDIAGLRAALDEGHVRSVRGLGPVSEARLRGALADLELDRTEPRIPLFEAVPLATRTAAALRQVDGVAQVVWSGELRRFHETVDAIGLAVATPSPNTTLDAASRMPWVREVVERGPGCVRLRSYDGPLIDVTAATAGAFGAALAHATGAPGHWAVLQRCAAERGLRLEPAGLLDGTGTGDAVPTPDETTLYAALDLPLIPAEQRDGSDEIDLARRGALPQTATVDDLRGDLHDHSEWSGDGRMPLADLVAAAEKRGWEYLAVTDHAENLRINGLDRTAMLAQREEIRRLRRRFDRIAVLHGAELNIAPDGTLDYDAEFLAGFDWTVASVHSQFGMDVAAQTRRMVAAIRHPAVHAIGHLTGRRIGRRPGIALDLDAVLDACRETGTALEINCHLDRLDAPADVLREAAARDVLVVISTDAHRFTDLDHHRWGVRQARRGRVPRDLVTNTWPAGRFLEWAGASV